MNADPIEMTPAVARALLDYSMSLPASHWGILKNAYVKARQSFSSPMALQIAERALFSKRQPSNRPPMV